MEEIWKPVPFNTSYEVSTLGNFRNAKTKRQKTFNIEALKSTQSRIRVDVKNTIKKGSGFYLHRLIAMTFIPNSQGLDKVSYTDGSGGPLEVNHIDGNPYNNCVSNLEWITREENMRHFHENREKYENKNVRQVLLCCSKTGATIQSYKCIDDCVVSMGLGITYATLYAALNTNLYEKPAAKPAKNSENKTYGTNKYVGVSYNKTNRKFVALYKNKYIGCFDVELDAAKAYDEHLRQLGILPRHVNFPGLGESQAIVGKRKYDNGVSKEKTGVYELTGRNQHLRFAEEIAKPEEDETNDVEWRQIAEAPNYSVSNTGLVKHTRLDRLLTGYNRNGYLQVTIKKDGVGIARLVHRLVASAFIANDDPVNRIYVDHIDTDPRNNLVSNLRWVTPKENMNNELTRQNISAGHMRKSPKVYQVEIQTGNIVNVADNAREMSKQTDVNINTIQIIAKYYKKVVKQGFDTTLMSVVPGEQKTFEGKWIFLYENECNMRIQIIKQCTLRNGDLGNPGKNVVQLDSKTGAVIATYSSMYEASKKLNINYSGISQVYNYHKYDDATRPVCYKLKSTHGFIFREKP